MTTRSPLVSIAGIGTAMPSGDTLPPAALPIATASALGGIKIGSGLAVAADGTVSASGSGGGAAPAVSAAQAAASFLDVSNSGYVTPNPSTFVAYPMANPSSDAGGNWNSDTWKYTAPYTGTYQVVVKARPQGGSGFSIGIGADTALRDSASFRWDQSTGNRQVLLNTRIVHLTAGDQLSMVLYYDGNSGNSLLFIYGSMTVNLLSVG